MKRTDNSQKTPAAAVAIIEVSSKKQILILRRAMRPDDHWSGHYSFPGGRREQEDSSLMATAIRETEEETGIRLKEHNLLQALEPSPAGRSKPQPLWVQPFHFRLESTPALNLADREVQSAHWLDLSAFRKPEGHTMREMLPPVSQENSILPGRSEITIYGASPMNCSNKYML